MSDSPVSAPNLTDPGDKTAALYAYQHAYGVILWVASYLGKFDYVALWCEQHEDFLGEISAEQFDGFQVKTRTPELGYWTFSDESLCKSIRRFAELDQKFPGQMRSFYFVSNAKCSSSKEKKKEHLSPLLILPLFLESKLCQWCKDALEHLENHTDIDRQTLLSVLRRTKIVESPPVTSMTAEILSNHLQALDSTNRSSNVQLGELLKRLTKVVSDASSRSTQDPARHFSAVNGPLAENAQLRAKRIGVRQLETHLDYLREIAAHSVNVNSGRFGASGSTGSRMAALIARYKAETEKDRELKRIVERLQQWHERPNGEVIGLEEKLRRGGRIDLVDFAVVAKEKFARALLRHENSPAAQEIYAYLLSKLWVNFTELVYPRIVAKDPPEEISRLLVDQVFPRIDELLIDDPLGLDDAQIKGMLYWLTGNCHLKWTPDANLQPSI